MYRRPRHPPPWWPPNEAWPPANRHELWRRGHSRFVRRMGCVFAAVLLLSAVGAAALLSVLLERAGLATIWSGITLLALFAAAAMAILLAVFVGGMRRVGFPLGDIVEAADRVAAGDFSARVVERGPPRLGSVARAFNSMTGRLQSQEQQRRHLMADIAHELRTPLTVIQGRLEGLVDGVYPRDDHQLNQVLDDTRVMARLVDDLRTLANAESGVMSLQKEPTDLAILIQDVVSSLAGDADAAHVTLQVATEDLPLVDVDPLRIREVLGNILSNAIRHTNAGGSITVRTHATPDQTVVGVADTGTGMPPEELSKIFDRFYKGATSRGSGLGLTIARNLVVAHGGDIRAESQVDHGTTITFTLPRSG